MLKKLIPLLVLILTSINLSAQTEKYFKDRACTKEVKQKKAKYLQKNFNVHDTITSELFYLPEGRLLDRSVFYHGEAVGVWMVDGKEYDFTNQPTFECGQENENVIKRSEFDSSNMVFPSFPGGEKELFLFLGKNMRYPEISREAGIQGVCFLSFVINENGEISDICVLRSPGPFLSAEAVRIVNLMPNFIPGTVNGKPGSFEYLLPIRSVLR